jgi:hypothetical protein
MRHPLFHAFRMMLRTMNVALAKRAREEVRKRGDCDARAGDGDFGVLLQRLALVGGHLREGPVHLSSGDLK